MTQYHVFFFTYFHVRFQTYLRLCWVRIGKESAKEGSAGARNRREQMWKYVTNTRFGFIDQVQLNKISFQDWTRRKCYITYRIKILYLDVLILLLLYTFSIYTRYIFCIYEISILYPAISINFLSLSNLNKLQRRLIILLLSNWQNRISNKK